ncbi:hypothetical protein GCM10009559_65500 [Pseudonocardia zijingensis]|uniref:IclR-ED domain-containing protein n=1 Tax=Pseudonocardia zijingensis TaxID=153376 RepID=A0ABP3YN43_9PSEU
MRSVAVPVHDATGAVVAALTVGTHTGQVDEDALVNVILPHLRDCAATIESTVTTRSPTAVATSMLYPAVRPAGS